jgi:hypothetical protein
MRSNTCHVHPRRPHAGNKLEQQARKQVSQIYPTLMPGAPKPKTKKTQVEKGRRREGEGDNCCKRGRERGEEGGAWGSNKGGLASKGRNTRLPPSHASTKQITCINHRVHQPNNVAAIRIMMHTLARAHRERETHKHAWEDQSKRRLIEYQTFALKLVRTS